MKHGNLLTYIIPDFLVFVYLSCLHVSNHQTHLTLDKDNTSKYKIISSLSEKCYPNLPAPV